MKLTDKLRVAADAIKSADALLITAGVGMGVDSGLPGFRGSQGVWQAYPVIAKLGLSFEEMIGLVNERMAEGESLLQAVARIAGDGRAIAFAAGQSPSWTDEQRSLLAALLGHSVIDRMGLGSGEIDALYTARTPSTFTDGSGRVRRLFADFPSVERDYFPRTRIFPIMHTVVIRRELYLRQRWIAQSLAKAFAAAQRLAYEDLAQTAALKVMLPWLPAHLEATRQAMGDDFWPDGLSRNREALATFLRYSHEQGLAARLLSPEDLFAPETLEAFKI